MAPIRDRRTVVRVGAADYAGTRSAVKIFPSALQSQLLRDAISVGETASCAVRPISILQCIKGTFVNGRRSACAGAVEHDVVVGGFYGFCCLRLLWALHWKV